MIDTIDALDVKSNEDKLVHRILNNCYIKLMMPQLRKFHPFYISSDKQLALG